MGMCIIRSPETHSVSDGIGRRFGVSGVAGAGSLWAREEGGSSAAQAMPCEKAARAGERQHDDERNQPLYLLHSGMCGRSACATPRTSRRNTFRTWCLMNTPAMPKAGEVALTGHTLPVSISKQTQGSWRRQPGRSRYSAALVLHRHDVETRQSIQVFYSFSARTPSLADDGGERDLRGRPHRSHPAGIHLEADARAARRFFRAAGARAPSIFAPMQRAGRSARSRRRSSPYPPR